MDSVQIYVAILLFLNIIAFGYLLGRGYPIKIERGWFSVIVNFAISLPVYGRIFGWW